MKKIAIIMTVLVLASCQSSPSLQHDIIGPEGLVRVKNTKLDSVYIRPGIDLSGYDSIMLASAGIRFRSVRDVSRTRIHTSSEFPLDERQRQLISESVREVFSESLQSSDRFKIVDQAGPNTLSLVGALTDVVSFVPPEAIGRTTYYLSSLGAATLLLELRDSESNQLLARAADGRTVESGSNGIMESNRVFNSSELKRELKQWAKTIKRGLELVLDTPITESSK